MRTLVISPSGNLYGSERVLLDFLECSKRKYHVFIPSQGLLINEGGLRNHRIFKYNNKKLISFYCRVSMHILFHRIMNVYINEGGHVKYIKLLAFLFPWVSFTIHIRLLEDTSPKRIGKCRKNMHIITISEYLQNVLLENGYVKVIKVNDPYSYTDRYTRKNTVSESLNLSLVGRYTISKGSALVPIFLKYLDENVTYPITFNIYGEVDDDPEIQAGIMEGKSLKNISLKLHGFVEDNQTIYHSSDIIIHFNKEEPLGRIFLEAIDTFTPLIGFASGGIQEIARKTGLEKYLVSDNDFWMSKMFALIELIHTKRDTIFEDMSEAKKRAKEIYSKDKYTSEIEEIIY